MLALLIGLLLVAPQEAEATTSLAELALKGAPIALVRVERVHAVQVTNKGIDDEDAPEDTLRIAEAVVERSFLGTRTRARHYFTLRRSDPDGETFVLEEGDRALVFLDPGSGYVFRRLVSDETMERIRPFVGPCSVPIPLPGGVWRVRPRTDAPVAQVPSTIDELPDSIAPHVVGEVLPLKRLLAWLDTELARVTNRMGARLLTHQGMWSIEIEADGLFKGTEEGRLESEQLDALWKQVDDERFFELPTSVGTLTHRRDQDIIQLWARRRDGWHEAWIFAVPPEELDTQQARDPLARALRIWDAIPGEKIARNPRR